MDTQQAGFFIEATSHCRDGKLPRWSFWVRGTGGSTRQGMIGTDEKGFGLYLYTNGDTSPGGRRLLMTPDSVSMPDSMSRLEANALAAKLLHRLGWGLPREHDTQTFAKFELRAIG